MVDCVSFLNSLLIYRFDQIESKDDQATQDLHGALYKIYNEVQSNDLHQITLALDHLLTMDFQFQVINSVLKTPIFQPFFVFDFKVVDGVLFFAAFYSVGNEFHKICEKHSLIFNSDKKIWYKKIPLSGELGVQQALYEMTNFFNDIKQISRVFFYKSSLQKFYRVG